MGLLFASNYCLVEVSGGAAVATLELLRALQQWPLLLRGGLRFGAACGAGRLV